MLTFDAAPDELELFLQEAEEQLQLLDQDIVLLEKEGPRPELLQEIFRAAHTLKGSSGALGHKKMASLTHSMENVLDQLRQGKAECGTGLIDLLLESLDALRLLKEEVETLQDCGFDPDLLVRRLDDMIAGGGSQGRPGQTSVGGPSHLADEVAVDSTPASPDRLTMGLGGGLLGDGSVLASGEDGAGLRVVIDLAQDSPLLSARCLQAYLEASNYGEVASCSPSLQAIENLEAGHRLEMVVITHAAAEMVKALQELPDVERVAADAITTHGEGSSPKLDTEKVPGGGDPLQKGTLPSELKPGNGTTNGRSSSLGKTVRIDVSRLDELMNLVGELVIDRTRLAQLGGLLQTKYEDEELRQLSETSEHIGRIVDELQESIMKARMLPVEGLFNRLPRVVRDLAQRSGKKIDFVVEGRETELDRSVIEELHDPLVHLLRNSVDHGIESPDCRSKAGKPEIGRIRLSAMHRENRILLRVEDDGMGIDPSRIRQSALDKGIISPEGAERLSDQEAVELIFAPGFSTASRVTDVSGRGVGMDIVRTNIERLNGSVSVDSMPGAGTRFTMELPLTLAIMDALMVGLGSEVLAIPLVSVIETLRVTRSEIHHINHREAIRLRDTVLPLIGLDQALGLPAGEATDRVFVVAVRVGEHKVGLVVDSLLGELQVVIKSLGRQVGTIEGVTGATILGDGRVALILDVPSLVKCVNDEQLRGRTA